MSKPLDEIEGYLARVRRHLYAVPATQKDELLAEMRGHLQAMVAENIAAGHNEEKATALALEQFGKPSRIGQDAARSWVLADKPLDLLKRMAWIWGWSALFGLGAELCIGFACGLFFSYNIMHGASYATSDPANVLFFQRLDSFIEVATLGMTGCGVLLGLCGRLPGTKLPGAAKL